MADVFVGYDLQNKHQAELIAEALRNSGFAVWWDHGAAAGEAYATAVYEQLATAKCVVVLWSFFTVESEWLQEQARIAAQRGVLVSVPLGHVTLPAELRGQIVVDFSTWAGREPMFRPLIEVVRKIVRGGGRDNQSHPPLNGDTPNTSTTSAIDQPTTKLFLCYRRDDTQDAAGRLHDRLVAAYSSDRVFMDIASVPLGIDFVDHVQQQISTCRAVIVMIGRQWLTMRDKHGKRRLDDPEDLVRVEITAALTQNVPVIPVLVQNASMPDRDDLPTDIRLLTRRNGIALRHDQWREGVARLLKELDPVMGKKH